VYNLRTGEGLEQVLSWLEREVLFRPIKADPPSVSRL
jgi:hypothetical protein